MSSQLLSQLPLLIPPFLWAITFHEFAHGYVAYRLGDPTAKLYGRLTLNPLAHLDVFGTLALVFVGFGWAKPVPVNPNNFRNPRRDDMLVSFAGPASNILSALLFGIIARFIIAFVGFAGPTSVVTILTKMVLFGVQLNIILAVFNLLPLHPLDGSHILRGFIPPRLDRAYMNFQRSGPIILMVLIVASAFLGIPFFSILFYPFLAVLYPLFTGLPIF